MTIRYWPETHQDTVSNRGNVITIQTTAGNRSDSLTQKYTGSVKKASAFNPSPVFQADSLGMAVPDLCGRNSIADITYYNPDFIIGSIGHSGTNTFPFLFIEKTRRIQTEKKAALEKHLKPGQILPRRPFHDDWALGIILAAIILFSVTRATAKSIAPGIARFFLFRGTKDESLRDIMGIFQWQSTVLNLSSFLITGLFLYFAADYYQLIPPEIPGILFWLISLGTIIAAVTLRHLVCKITGILSGQEEVFRDYLHTVYQSYRFNALFFFILIILMSYAGFLSGKGYIITGILLFSSLYLIRILRLFIIFINRNISIFYLILYLCALEILPVLIITKYFSGLT
jgi:hypothetical protein